MAPQKQEPEISTENILPERTRSFRVCSRLTRSQAKKRNITKFESIPLWTPKKRKRVNIAGKQELLSTITAVMHNGDSQVKRSVSAISATCTYKRLRIEETSDVLLEFPKLQANVPQGTGVSDDLNKINPIKLKLQELPNISTLSLENTHVLGDQEYMNDQIILDFIKTHDNGIEQNIALIEDEVLEDALDMMEEQNKEKSTEKYQK